jgi:hypothetical protein
MWAVNSPQMDAEEVARSCAKGLRDAQLRNAVLAAIPDFISNSSTYRARAAVNKFHDSTPADYPVSGLTYTQVQSLYTNRLARPRSPARRIYDELMSAATHGLCTYCRHGQAMTLDHFLPKAVFSGLSIEPWNLVPSCQRCNHRLGETWEDDPDTEMLHPYAMPDLGRWLRATIEHTTPAVVRFYIDPDSTLDARLASRMCHQFDRLDLARHYTIVSSQELTGLGRRLRTISKKAEDVRSFLREMAAIGFASDLNDRRGSMYEALASDNWYCEGGFAMASA